MTLFELSSELFLFLVTFRRKVRKGILAEPAEVRSELQRIFATQEANARTDPRLAAVYEKAKYPLAVLADEVVLSCGWAHAGSWEDETLEEHYFGTRIGGEEFFILIEKLRDDEGDLAQIFYSCLCLGFRGRFKKEDAQELRNLRSRLYRQIPEYSSSQGEKLCPEAYRVTKGSAAGLTPLVNLARVAVISIGFLMIYLVINQVFWSSVTGYISGVADILRKAFENS